MPTYEFRCPKGHEFEKFYPTMNAPRRIKCPTCGQPAERLISGGAGLHFKGSGFYITDYKRAGEKPPESEAESKSETKSEKKAEPKPEKPKTKPKKDK